MRISDWSSYVCSSDLAQIDDLIQRRPQQILLPIVPWLAHRPSPKPKTCFRESRRTRIRESQIARKPAPSPSFPANPIISLSPIREPDQRLAASSRTTPSAVQRSLPIPSSPLFPPAPRLHLLSVDFCEPPDNF